MVVTITAAELSRIQASVKDEAVTDRENKRRQLKTLSDNRISSWPNTLASNRAQKLTWKAERSAADEQKRREVDQVEAEITRNKRIATLERAENMIYAQTDKMKGFRGMGLYTDVIEGRVDQVSNKQQRIKVEKVVDQKWHDDMMVQLKKDEIKEVEKAAARKQKSKDIAISQQSQLNESRNELITKLKAEHAEGLIVKQLAVTDLENEEKKVHLNIEKVRLQNAAMLTANMNLKDIRKDALKIEVIEADKRHAQVANMTRIVKARKDLEIKHFSERQKVRERLIELATKDLNDRKIAEDTILDKHIYETEVKYQDEMELRRIRKEKALNAIDKSRSMQIKLKGMRVDNERDQALLLAEHWKIHNREIEAEEAKEEQDKYNKTYEIRKSQESQVLHNTRKKQAEKDAEMKRDMQVRAVMLEDDEKFKAFAEVEIQRFKARGKKTFLLERARDAKDVLVLAGKDK